MPLGEFTTVDGVWIALTILLVAAAVGLTLVLVRLAGTIGRLTHLVEGLEREALPVINEAGGTLERVNAQLDKADVVTTSAVDAADGVDTAVRAVTIALVKPAQKVSAVGEGVAHAMAALRAGRRGRDAYSTGREAAARREQAIADELMGSQRDEP
jgi:uncharacterized protein YoxC